jgi:DNA-binding HxlR family transcriptional regulator
MHADGETGSARPRAGGAVLSLLAGPLCVPILRAHLDGPLRLPDLRERIGGAAQTTLRGQVGNLRGLGALERKVIPGMPYTVENRLTECGREILEVAERVEAWLTRAPQGPVVLGSEAAKGAIRALVGGWSSTVLRALAARPLSLTELNSEIKDLSYPALERRLSAMRAARQIEVEVSGPGKAKPYFVSEWTRLAVAPLVAAARCECRHLAEVTDPMDELDVEAVFLLAVPLAAPPADRSGSCLFAVGEPDDETAAGPAPRVAGVQVEVERGEVVSHAARAADEPETWAMGAVGAWVDAILVGELESLRFGGQESRYAKGLVESVHRALAPV